MAAHVHGHGFAIRSLYGCAHRFGVLGTEVKDLTHLDPACRPATLFGNGVEKRLVMRLVGARIEVCELFHDALTLRDVVIVDLAVAKGQIGHGAIVEDFRFTCVGQHQKFMGVIAANRA